jgi:amidohydrolase
MSRKESAEQAFSSVEGELQSISRWMYDNPELGYQEFESSRRLGEFLGAHGFEVSYPAYGLDTAFEANAGSTGPRVVICCEYDALPSVGHACGHNIIATSSVGAGAALAGLADELGIRVTVLGTPAEEGGGGKVALIDAGAFEDAAASMMIHPSPKDQLDPSFQARESFTVEYFGKDSHAAATPHMGINALDAFVQSYLNWRLSDSTCLPTTGFIASSPTVATPPTSFRPTPVRLGVSGQAPTNVSRNWSRK